MNKRTLAIFTFIITVGASFYLGTMFAGTEEPIRYEGTVNEIFQEVMAELLENHYSQPTEEELWEGAIDGMIESLNDPYTTYFDKEEAEQYQAGYGESYVGIGVTVSFTDDVVLVEAVKDGGPAENAGIQVNDIITHVDGESVMGANFYEIIGNIIGEEGTEVTIGVMRSGVDDIIYLTMTRAVIENSTIKYTSYESEGKNIGYIEVTTFGDETASLFYSAIQSLETEGIDGLIVDLRNNGGGHLNAVLNMLNAFLIDNGQEMFSIEYYQDGEFFRQEFTGANQSKKPYNIVTLVNGNSASASEVFASSMQEHGDYPVIGTTTFGKGTMQSTIPVIATLGDKLHITIGKWITSDGTWVHYDGGTDGVIPDLEVIPTAEERAYKLFLFDETLDFNTVDNRIANMQIILNIMGYSVRTDGYFDQATLDAINEIQTNNSLPTTNNVDSQTLQYLNAALDVYQDDTANDSQLQAAIDYLVDNPINE